jgi:hypothetical protein
MMEGLLNFLTGLALALIVMVVVAIRRAHIRVEYSVSWLGAAFTLLVFSRWHAPLNALAGALGMEGGPLALLTLVGCLFLLVLFRFSVIISHLKDHNIALAQRVAILEFHLRSLDEKIQAQS